MSKTIIDKIWEAHEVRQLEGGAAVLYIDRHLIHEVTSPQAFSGLKKRGIGLFRKEQITATVDHNVPTVDQHLPIKDALSKHQVDTLIANCEEYELDLYGLGHERQGIVHVIGPEIGVTQPGRTIVCGDSHTSTHGAFGAIAFGIGTSQVEQVMATQCLILARPKTMRVTVDGELGKGVSAKDVILYIIAKLGAEGGSGYFVEYAGSTFRSMSMEERMTVCNMSIEMGARGGLVAPDETTYAYLKGRPMAPQGEEWDKAVAYWKTLPSDEDSTFDVEHHFSADDIAPMVTFGTSPDTGVAVNGHVPDSVSAKAEAYMHLNKGLDMQETKADYVFIGSCTNSRLEDLRAAAALIKGKKKAEHVTAWVVPGSVAVMKQAQEEGLADIFREAGFEFREPGCSACLAMNDDKIPAGALCVSTSNRNFEGRQGPGARTVLASPLTA
ncbi:MAG TPA: 3-isopropylmalate dehydratase large subunit, partial [Cytophagales bacterium]|nr:3-isopropylmalate dehydratase large subunit [Cytophagales bacterium]